MVSSELVTDGGAWSVFIPLQTAVTLSKSFQRKGNTRTPTYCRLFNHRNLCPMRYGSQSTVHVHCNTCDGVFHPVYPYPAVFCIAPLGSSISQLISEEISSYLGIPEMNRLHITIFAPKNNNAGNGGVPDQCRYWREVTISLDCSPGFRRIHDYCPIVTPTGQMFPVRRRPYNIY